MRRSSSPLLRALACLRARTAAEATTPPPPRPPLLLARPPPPLPSPPSPLVAAWASPRTTPPLRAFASSSAPPKPPQGLPPGVAASSEGDLQIEPEAAEDQVHITTTAATATADTATTTKKPRDMAIAFSCGKCGARAVKAFSRQAYERGVVIVQCPGCKARHLIADNLGWFPRDGACGNGGGENEGGEAKGDARWRVEDLAKEGRTDVRRLTLQQAVEEEEEEERAKGGEEGAAGRR